MLYIFSKLLLITLFFLDARAQNLPRYGVFDTNVEFKSNNSNNDLTLANPILALEESINPDKYIIGPGDKFGINIDTMEKMFFSASVGPSGDLLIPGVGSVQISGNSLNVSIEAIKKRISKTFKNANIDISLIGLKSFKIASLGAVNNPGFAVIQAGSRLDEFLGLVGGLHRDADENNIIKINKVGDSSRLVISKYLADGNLEHNPILNEGDVIEVPFKSNKNPELGKVHTLKKTPILVSGFVNNPGPLRYFPGYSIGDYIGLAGGISEIGDSKKIFLIRDNFKIKTKYSETVLPGDQIIIPEGTFSVIFGKNSFLQNLTALFSIISTYTIISDRLNNN